MSRFVLLDRDGVINRRPPDGYVTTWEDFAFLPGALEGLALLARNHIATLIVSNQSCVGKGLLTPEKLQNITRRFARKAREHGGEILGVYYCQHRPGENCDCKKPKPGMILQAQREHGFEPRETFFIGDSLTDCEAAGAAGCPFVLIAEDDAPNAIGCRRAPRAVHSNLLLAAQFVVSQYSRSE